MWLALLLGGTAPAAGARPEATGPPAVVRRPPAEAALVRWESSDRAWAGPLLLRNDNPLYLTLFSAALPDRARVVAPGGWGWGAGYLDSNILIDQDNEAVTDRVLIDGELHRMEVAVRYGLRDRWEVGAAIPYLVLGDGYLDTFIQSFEDAFGLTTPRARRVRGKNELRYLVRLNSVNVVDKEDETIHGLGDLPVQVKYQVRDADGGWLPRMAVRGVVQVPTATDPLLGSGRVDVGLGWLGEQPIGRRILLVVNGDVTTAHLPLPLKTVDIDPVMASGTLSVEHRLTARASWAAQITAATNPYPTFHRNMTVVNRAPIGVGLGWRYRLSPRSTMTLALGENVDSAWPDFQISAAIDGAL